VGWLCQYACIENKIKIAQVTFIIGNLVGIKWLITIDKQIIPNSFFTGGLVQVVRKPTNSVLQFPTGCIVNAAFKTNVIDNNVAYDFSFNWQEGLLAFLLLSSVLRGGNAADSFLPNVLQAFLCGFSSVLFLPICESWEDEHKTKPDNQSARPHNLQTARNRNDLQVRLLG